MEAVCKTCKLEIRTVGNRSEQRERVRCMMKLERYAGARPRAGCGPWQGDALDPKSREFYECF